jgi:hypothetical protein
MLSASCSCRIPLCRAQISPYLKATPYQERATFAVCSCHPMQPNPITCTRCGGTSTLRRIRIEHRLHLLLTIVTAGLWGVCWLVLLLGRLKWPLRCVRCCARCSIKQAIASGEKVVASQVNAQAAATTAKARATSTPRERITVPISPRSPHPMAPSQYPR